MTKQHLLAQLRGYSLTTAEILYRMPDHPGLIQSFIWQDYDLAPRFPRLGAFLTYWNDHLEGPLYRITVSHKKLVSPAEFQFIGGEFVLH
ncbi:MAG: aspartate-semialdehyde dehydrogenase [Rhodomicrobiaceae bacterium]